MPAAQAQNHELIACTGGLLSRMMAGMARGYRAVLPFEDRFDQGAYCLDAPEYLPTGSSVWVPAGYATSDIVSR